MWRDNYLDRLYWGFNFMKLYVHITIHRCEQFHFQLHINYAVITDCIWIFWIEMRRIFVWLSPAEPPQRWRPQRWKMTQEENKQNNLDSFANITKLYCNYYPLVSLAHPVYKYSCFKGFTLFIIGREELVGFHIYRDRTLDFGSKKRKIELILR